MLNSPLDNEKNGNQSGYLFSKDLLLQIDTSHGADISTSSIKMQVYECTLRSTAGLHEVMSTAKPMPELQLTVLYNISKEQKKPDCSH